MGRKALKKDVNADGVPWLTIAEAKGRSEGRCQRRVDGGDRPEEAGDLADETLSQRKWKMLKGAIEEENISDDAELDPTNERSRL